MTQERIKALKEVISKLENEIEKLKEKNGRLLIQVDKWREEALR